MDKIVFVLILISSFFISFIFSSQGNLALEVEAPSNNDEKQNLLANRYGWKKKKRDCDCDDDHDDDDEYFD